MYEKIDHSTGIDRAYAVVKGTLARLAALGPTSQSKAALILYDEVAQDTLSGFRDVHTFDRQNWLPIATTRGKKTDTLGGFAKALALLQHVSMDAPPPLVCHLTDGFVTQYTQGNPQIIPEMLTEMMLYQGTTVRPVRVAHVVVGDQVLRTPIHDVRTWPGVLWEHDLHPDAPEGRYARILFRMSSLLPQTALPALSQAGYTGLSGGSRLLFPSTVPALVVAAVVATAFAQDDAEQ